jgi:exonuclease SbcD
MGGKPFRFLHSSDFHLEQPPHGLAEVPDHLVELLTEAPYRAAARVFDLALAEEVDFVVLAGNLVHPHQAGPRGLTFLHEQFARLEARGVVVYWAAGEIDCREQWPAHVAWPSNVRLFSSHRVERFVHSYGGEPLCQIAGLSVDGTTAAATRESGIYLDEFAGSAGSLFTIGVIPHTVDAIALADLQDRYWALGGEANCSTPLSLANPQRVAYLAGSPQGRLPAENGPHGCTVVDVDVESQVRLVPRAADVVRFHHERIVVDAAAERSELERLMHERLMTLIAATPDCILLIRWTLVGDGPLLTNARRSALAAGLTSILRTDNGFRTPSAWTTAVEIESPAILDEWYEQETLLGDYLRAARSLEHSQVEPLGIQAYLSDRQLAGPLADIGAIVEPAARRSILRQAAVLGAELLQPDVAAIDSLSENHRGLSPFSAGTIDPMVAEKKGTAPLSADGFRTRAKEPSR